MKIKPLTRLNIDEVMGNLSELSKKEIEVFGSTVEEVKQRFESFIGMPFTGAFYHSITHCKYDIVFCCAICALENIGENVYLTHFVSREGGLEKIAFPLTRFLKRLTDNLVQYKGTMFEIISAYGMESAKWFETLGFKFIETKADISKYVKKAV